MIALALFGGLESRPPPRMPPKPWISPPFLSTSETISQARFSGSERLGADSFVVSGRAGPGVTPPVLVATSR